MGFFSKKSRSVSESGQSKPTKTQLGPPVPKLFSNTSTTSLNSPASAQSPSFTKLDLSAPSSAEGWSTPYDDSPAPSSPYSAANHAPSTSRLTPSASSRFPNPFRTLSSPSSNTSHRDDSAGAYRSQVPLTGGGLGDDGGRFTPPLGPASASGTASVPTSQPSQPKPPPAPPAAVRRGSKLLPAFTFDSAASGSSLNLRGSSGSSWEEIGASGAVQSPPAIDTSDLALAPPDRTAIFGAHGGASSPSAGSTVSLPSTLNSPDVGSSPVERENTPPLGTLGSEKEKRSRWKLVGRSAGAPKKRNSLGALQLLGTGSSGKSDGGFEVTNFRSVARVAEDDPIAAPPSSRSFRDDRSSRSTEPDRISLEPELIPTPFSKTRQASSPAILTSPTQRPTLSPQQQPRSSFRGSEPERAPSPTISADSFRLAGHRTKSSLSLASGHSISAELAKDTSLPPSASARFQPDRRAAVRRSSQGSMTFETPASLASHGRRASQLWDDGSPRLAPPTLPFVNQRGASSSSLGSYGTADEGENEGAEELSPEAISRPTSAMGGRTLRQAGRDSSSEAELRILSMYARTDSRPSTAYTEDTPRPLSRSSIGSPVSPGSGESHSYLADILAAGTTTSPPAMSPSSPSSRSLVPPPQPGAPAGMAKGAGKGAAPLLALQPPTPSSGHDFTPATQPAPSPSKPPAKPRKAGWANSSDEDSDGASSASSDSEDDDDVPLQNLRNASVTSLHRLAGTASPGPGSPALPRRPSNEVEVLSEVGRPFFAEPTMVDSPGAGRTVFGARGAPTGQQQQQPASSGVDPRTGRPFPRHGNERRSISNLSLPVANLSSSPSSPSSLASFGPQIGQPATYLSTPASSNPPSPLNRTFARSSSAGQLSGILAKPNGIAMAAGSTSSSSGASDPSSSMPRTPKDLSPVPSNLGGGKLPTLNGSNLTVNKMPSAERLVSFSVPPSPGREESGNRKWQARRVGQPMSSAGGSRVGANQSQVGAGTNSSVTSRGRPVPRAVSSAPIPSNASYSAGPPTPTTPGSSYDRMKARHRAETREALALGADLNGDGLECRVEEEDEDTPLAALPTRFGGSNAGGSVVGGYGGGGSQMGGSVMSGMGGGMLPAGVNPMVMMQHQPVAAGGYAQLAYPPPGVDPYLYASLPNDQKLSLHQRSAQMMGMMQQAALSARAESMVGVGGGQWGEGSQEGGAGGGGQRPGSAMGSHGGGGGMGGRRASVQSSMSGMGGMPMHPMMMGMGMGSHQSMLNLAQFGAMPSPASPMGSMSAFGSMGGGGYGMPMLQQQHQQQFLPSFAPHFGAAPWTMGGGGGSMVGVAGGGGGYAGSEMGGVGGGGRGGTRGGGPMRTSASTLGLARR